MKTVRTRILMRCRWMLHAFAAWLGVLLSYSLALGQESTTSNTSSLSWVRLLGAEQCISTHELARRVEARIGRSVFVSASEAELSFEGRIERVTEQDAWLATLVVSDRQGRILGRRQLRAVGAACAAIDSSLVLVFAIAIAPDAARNAVVGRDRGLSAEANQLLSQLDLPHATDADMMQLLSLQRPVQPNVPTTSAQAASPVPVPDHNPQSAPLMAAGSRWRLLLAAAADAGVIPGPALGSLVGASYHARRLGTLDLLVFGYLPRLAPISHDDGTRSAWSAQFLLYGAAVRGCPLRLGHDALHVELCAGLRAGVMSVHGRGFSQGLTTRGPWAQLELLGRAAVSLGAFGLWIAAGPGAALVRDALQYEDAATMLQTFHRPSAVSFTANLGASYQIH